MGNAMPVCCMPVPCLGDPGLASATADTPTFLPNLRRAKVVKVYDGDTIHVVARTGWRGRLWRWKVRLAGIDAPELRSKVWIGWLRAKERAQRNAGIGRRGNETRAGNQTRPVRRARSRKTRKKRQPGAATRWPTC